MPRKKRAAGRPAADRAAFLAAGKIRRPHGVAGEALVEIFTDFPERLRPKKEVYLGERHLPLTIRSSRRHDHGLLLAFEGIRTPEEVGRYRNLILYVSTVKRPVLPPGSYYQDELLGMQVVAEDGCPLGEIAEIMQTRANDVFVVKAASGDELLLPATAEVILKVDLSKRVIRVHLLPGLMDEDHVG
jgi:16S rRNA processing protein RimM